MAAEMMHQHARRLLVLGEVATLVKPTGAGRVHEEVGRTHQLDDQAARAGLAWLRRGRHAIARVEGDVADGREGILDLVASRIVVDVVGHDGLVGRVKDDEIHGVETNTTPGADAQRPASQMMDDWWEVSPAFRMMYGNQSFCRLTDFAGVVGLRGEQHLRARAVRHRGGPGAHGQAPSQTLARLHGLVGQILAHRVGDGIAVLARLNALLGQQLDLGPSVEFH